MKAQDTFSIVAVDPETGEVGSAGATCLDLVQESAAAIIISDVLPGKGAIHTQSFYIPLNQTNARARMLAGDSPAEIISWLQANDAQGNPAARQYGIVDFDDQDMPRSAAFTGVECFSYKGQRVGDTYAIQGNILLGPEILDSMEARFISTDGTLAEKLMSAMQGANVVGADSRCLDDGVSSRSAFLRVAKPDDAGDDLYIDIQVNATPQGVEPIDSLQQAFDELVVRTKGFLRNEVDVDVFPNPNQGQFTLRIGENEPTSGWTLELHDHSGRLINRWTIQSNPMELDLDVAKGAFYLRVFDQDGRWRGLRKVVLN